MFWKILKNTILSDSFGSHFYLAMEIPPVGVVIPCLSGEMPISPPFPGEALLPILQLLGPRSVLKKTLNKSGGEKIN